MGDCGFVFFFFKQKTAYEMRISDWSSDVCSSDLVVDGRIVDRDHIFDAAVEVARHPVGAADIELRAAVRQRRAVGERPDAAMFEEPADDRFHAARFWKNGHDGTQAANAAHTQVDRHARRARPVQTPGSGTWRERVGRYVEVTEVDIALKK